MSHRTHHPHIFVALLAAVLLAGAVTAAVAQAGGSSRDPIWLKQWVPPGTDFFDGGKVAYATTGDVYVAGTVYRTATTHYDLCVARYTTSGVRTWVRTRAVAAGSHTVMAVAADAHGNVIVVGDVATATHGTDWLVAKWNRGGTLLWKKQIDGTAHSDDDANDVAVAADGSITVVGLLYNTGTSGDATVIKYAPGGGQLWKRSVDASHSYDSFNAVALDTTGNAYAAGYDYVTGRANDALLVRYDPNGSRKWMRHLGDPVALKHESFLDVAVRGGYVAAGGTTENDPNPANWEERGLLAKYTTAHGTLMWSRRLENPGNALRDAGWKHVGIDSSGRVAAAGWAVTSPLPGDGEWLATVYSATGTIGTLQTVQGTNTAGNRVQDVLSTAGGTVYVTGSLGDIGAGQDLYTLALSATGAAEWGSLLNDPAGANDMGGGLAVTSKRLYVGAFYYRSLALAKYAR